LPIIGCHVAALSRMNHTPGKKHWRASSDVLRCLATSGDARIVFQRTNEPGYWYVDSDFLPNVLGPVPGVNVMAKRPQGLLNVGALSARMAVLRSCALDI
jgi:hypothetical protein